MADDSRTTFGFEQMTALFRGFGWASLIAGLYVAGLAVGLVAMLTHVMPLLFLEVPLVAAAAFAGYKYLKAGGDFWRPAVNFWKQVGRTPAEELQAREHGIRQTHPLTDLDSAALLAKASSVPETQTKWQEQYAAERTNTETPAQGQKAGKV